MANTPLRLWRRQLSGGQLRALPRGSLLKNLRRPEPSVNVVSLARNEGYLVENDRLTNVTKIYDKAGLEIEFLIENKGAGIETSLKTNLGVTAQTLRHMNILIKNTIDVEYLGMHINIPCPEAYTVHKIVINNERKSKMKKDQKAIENIWSYLNSQKLIEIRAQLTKKEKKIVDAYIEEHNLKCDIL